MSMDSKFLPTRRITLSHGGAYEYRFNDVLILEALDGDTWLHVPQIVPEAFGVDGLVALADLLAETKRYLGTPGHEQRLSVCATCKSNNSEDCGVCRAVARGNLS